VPLADLKRGAREAAATVNDLLVAALSGGLGRYLRARQAGVEELHALMPVNLRPLDRPLPRALGNRFGLLIVGLPVGIRSQRKRLATVKERMGALKRSRQGPVSYAILGALGLTRAPLDAAAVNFFTAKATLVLSNVPGPPASLQTAGTEVAGVLVWAPCCAASASAPRSSATAASSASACSATAASYQTPTCSSRTSKPSCDD
jgi:diacylglycerol O-acyltransferase / wax synthase